ERAADPLHYPRIDSELFGNDADTGPPRSRQGLADSFFQYRGNRGAPEAFTLYPLPFTLYPLPFTLYPLPFTLYPLPFPLYPFPFTLSPLPFTFTLYHLPFTLSLYPLPFTLYPLHFTFTLYLYPLPDPRKPGTDSFRHHRSLELPSGSRVRMKRT